MHLSASQGISTDSVEYTQSNTPYVVDTNSGEQNPANTALTRWVLDTNTPGAQATLDGNHITLTFDDTYTDQQQTQEVITVRFPKNFMDSPLAANTWPKPNMIEGNENIERTTPIHIDITSDGDLDIQPTLDAMGSMNSSSTTELKAWIEWRPDPDPAPTEPLPYTGNMCDYPLLIDSNGNITMDSVSDAYNSVLAQLEAGEITQAEATYILPDLFNAFDSVGAITSADFSSALNQVIASGGSISCSIPPPEVDEPEDPGGEGSSYTQKSMTVKHAMLSTPPPSGALSKGKSKDDGKFLSKGKY